MGNHHSAHFLLQDLKPGNLAVNQDCELKVCTLKDYNRKTWQSLNDRAAAAGAWTVINYRIYAIKLSNTQETAHAIGAWKYLTLQILNVIMKHLIKQQIIFTDVCYV